MSKASKNVRAEAARCLLAVLDKGQSLSDVLPQAQINVGEKDAALLQEMCFGTIRHFARYDAICHQLLTKKLKGKQRVFHHLVIVGLYQLEHMRIPEHAAVAETVQAAVALKAQGLKGLVNACLRNFMRNKDVLLKKTTNPVTEYNHPSWFIKRIQAAYPAQWQDILEQNLQRAPMWLRVHTSNKSLTEFCAALDDAKIEYEVHPHNPTALRLLAPKPVDKIPGFDQGWFVVQDAAAQNAALLLDASDNEQVLDACAAPGGKTCHVLDTAKVKMVAADIDETRLSRVQENLTRLRLEAQLVCGDLSDPKTLESFEQFDSILLDAPCSATGVIRRHPDIKWLRRNEDIEQLSKLQADILQTMWDKLKPGGTLLYATCSILPDENKLQMKQFLTTHADANLVPIGIAGNSDEHNESETVDNPGWQILPGEYNMDGFYYCRLKKSQ